MSATPAKLDQALRLHRAGRLAEAERAYLEVLGAEPSNADACHWLGMLLFHALPTAESAALVERSVLLAPHVAEFHNNLAGVPGRAGPHPRRPPPRGRGDAAAAGPGRRHRAGNSGEARPSPGTTPPARSSSGPQVCGTPPPCPRRRRRIRLPRMTTVAPQRVVFNSSFPRSGSTLLQNILAQNPRFYCSATSGLMNLLLAARHEYTAGPLFKSQEPELMRKAFNEFCARGVSGFYAGLTDRPVCVDKHRAWFHYYDWLKMFIPDPKIVVCVRDIRGILSSMEKLFRGNRDLEDPADTIDRMNMISVGNRMTHWLTSPPVGLTFLRLMEAVQTGTVRHFHIVRFEDLTSHPRETLRKVYAYLGEPEFGHDFNRVEQATHEDDSQFVIYGRHRIREKVAPVPPDWNEVLGKDLCDTVKSSNPLFYNTFYPNAR